MTFAEDKQIHKEREFEREREERKNNKKEKELEEDCFRVTGSHAMLYKYLDY
jgi:hypothetical protein